ncbi:MAG: hypothetical protein PHV37_03290 [Candidatus Gastranaerophilales bacterium]|nr:hypothetical protein [Candidatus Gastranaerophilales bacterium]
MSLVSTHMYKQFLEYQHSNLNTAELFSKMIENMQMTVEYLKQSFTARGIPTQNICLETDSSQNAVIMTILWHTISFVANVNDRPQALHIENELPLFTGRIMALRGDYRKILKDVKDDYIQTLLEHEVASLYVPAEKTQSAVIKIVHLGNKEHYINQMDASREFLLKVIETICGGGIYHQENTGKKFTF